MAVKNLDDVLPQEWVEKRTRHYELKEIKKKKSDYWNFLGELMYYGGFQAVQAVLDDYIDIPQAMKLLEGSKRAYYGTVYDSANANLAANAAIHKSSEFDRIIGFYKREML